jgi:FtsZ-binding cell division protein ZapB
MGNVWTVDKAVDEILRLQVLVRELRDPEMDLRQLVEDMRQRAQSFQNSAVQAQLKWAADKLNARLLPLATFKLREPGQ